MEVFKALVENPFLAQSLFYNEKGSFIKTNIKKRKRPTFYYCLASNGKTFWIHELTLKSIKESSNFERVKNEDSSQPK